MPDGTEDCGMILARLDNIENLQREQAQIQHALREQLDRIEEKQARKEAYEAGREEVYARLGKRVIQFFAVIGAAWACLHWYVSEGGRDWLKSIF